MDACEGLEALRAYAEAVKCVAEMVARVAEYEERTGRSLFKAVKEATAPASMLRVAERAPPDAFARLVTLLLRLSLLSSQLAGVFRLPPQAKMRLAGELREVAGELSEAAGSIAGLLHCPGRSATV